MKVIKNMDGVRNGLGEHSEVMFSLDGKPQENSGRVIGAILCWGTYEKSELILMTRMVAMCITYLPE